jgi:hypothetical protein
MKEGMPLVIGSVAGALLVAFLSAILIYLVLVLVGVAKP